MMGLQKYVEINVPTQSFEFSLQNYIQRIPLVAQKGTVVIS
jgi:hypothetical protein